MDSGVFLLLFLFVLVPLVNLSWVTTEIILAGKLFNQRSMTVSILMPTVAFFFFLESLGIILYFTSLARM